MRKKLFIFLNKNWVSLITKKKQIKRALFIKFKKKNKLCNKRRYTYLFIFSKPQTQPWFIHNFQAFYYFAPLLKNKKKIKKYTLFYKLINIASGNNRADQTSAFRYFSNSRSIIIRRFIYTYVKYLTTLYTDVFYFFKKNKINNVFLHRLIFNFRNLRFYINFLNPKKKNCLSLSAGLFIKFFEKKKSLKKAKATKLLMVRYMRKVFLLSKLTNIILFVKNIPIFLSDLVGFLNQPIPHKFYNPLTFSEIDEMENPDHKIKFLYLVFLNNVSFVKNKIKKSARVKRKIRRKIILAEQVSD